MDIVTGEAWIGRSRPAGVCAACRGVSVPSAGSAIQLRFREQPRDVAGGGTRSGFNRSNAADGLHRSR
jgi:hypothetical protein